MGLPKDLQELEQTASEVARTRFESEPVQTWDLLYPDEPSPRARRMAWQATSVPYCMLLFLINAHRRLDPDKYMAWHGTILAPFVGKPFSGNPAFDPATNAFMKLVYHMGEASRQQQDSFLAALQWFCEDLGAKDRPSVERVARLFVGMSESVDAQLG